MNPKTVKAIARKEYFHLIRDFRSLYLAFIIPLLLILLFGYALSLDVEHIRPWWSIMIKPRRAAILSEGLTPHAISTSSPILPDTAAPLRPLITIRPSWRLSFRRDWTEKLKSDRKSPLQVIIDGSDPNYAGNTRAFITAYISPGTRIS